MKRTAQALTLGMLLLALPAFAQEKPNNAVGAQVPTVQATAQATNAPATAVPATGVRTTPQATTVQAPAPAAPLQPAPVKDPNNWKRPLGEIKFREF